MRYQILKNSFWMKKGQIVEATSESAQRICEYLVGIGKAELLEE